MNLWWLLIPASYALGTFPTAHIVAGLVGHDPTAEGSGNPGATNVYRVAGAKAGVIVLLGDLLKGLTPTLVCLLIDGRLLGLAAGMAAMVGHIAPITRKFNGGKGVATLAGFSVALYPFVVLALFVIWIPLMKFFRRASLGSLVMVLLFPLGVLIMPETRWYEVVITAVASLLVTLRHHENIKRLFKGQEHAIE
ncbi:MAG: glycerol-3-phosphate 1-O-acyltransferase PlsY [Acidimicrobiales bacterium]|jgi:glycerol-3-phosphate acyltransferase PlsY|nr:glycerol-3-phosphate 1-O-acyltransferase PlsY [Acidimicrobiales bacterium]|tara:strand:+ start:97 stop:678 length:582 start_codon:yes stop_codon:yes gene_type:complete